MSDQSGKAGAKRAVARHMADPCRYQPPETFDTLLSPEEKAFILSGWGGVPWTEVEEPKT